MEPAIGFREHAHTADWELEVWAPNLAALLEQAAKGMYALAGMKLQKGHPLERNLKLEAADAESLLVRFLAELLWLEENENVGFDRISITLSSGFNLHASLKGCTILSVDKEIKAITYHNLVIQTTPRGLSTRIVFDV